MHDAYGNNSNTSMQLFPNFKYGYNYKNNTNMISVYAIITPVNYNLEYASVTSYNKSNYPKQRGCFF